MRTQQIILLTIILMVTSMVVWAQNEAPQIVNVNQISLVGSDVQDFLVINGAGYVRTDCQIAKINLTTRQTEWTQAVSFSGVLKGNSMVKTPDGNICYTDNGYIKKVSPQGDTLWSTDLRSLRSFGNFSISANSSQFLVCYSMTSRIVLLDYVSGLEINNWLISTGGIASCGYHNAWPAADSVFYCFDTTPNGLLYNTEIKLTKVKIENGNANIIWCLQVDDLYQANGIVDGNNIYFHGNQVDPWTNSLIYKITDNGSCYSIDNIIDVAGDSVGFVGNMVLHNHQLFLPIAIRLGDDPNGEDGYRGSTTLYDNTGNLVWRIDQTLAPFCLTQLLAIQLANVYTISMCLSTYAGARSFWLTEISTTTPIVDPTVITPTPQLACYPNPFRGNINLKFNQTEMALTSISIYNIKGQLVRTLIRNSKLSPGEHLFTWDGKTNSGRPTAAGIYFYKMTAGGSTRAGKILLK